MFYVFGQNLVYDSEKQQTACTQRTEFNSTQFSKQVKHSLCTTALDKLWLGTENNHVTRSH